MLRNRGGKHTQTINSEHRTAIVLLLDMSGSMTESIEYEGCLSSKCSCLQRVAEQILQGLYLRANIDGALSDCYDVAIVSYSGRGVMTHLGDGESPFMPITKVHDTIEEISINGVSRFDTPEDIADKYKRGVTLEPCGDSPMYEVLLWLYGLLEEWCSQPDNMDSYPPTIFHITDGHATDGTMDDIVDIVRNIVSLGTNDGDALVFNMQLGDHRHGETMIYPTAEEAKEHLNSYFSRLCEASSYLPEQFEEAANQRRSTPTTERILGVGYNASIADIVSMMKIGK